MKDYKEILKGIISIINTAKNSDIRSAIRAYIYVQCPELGESEDKRIRKEIMDCLMTYVPHNDLDLARKLKVWIAWLEKQGKQKPTDLTEPQVIVYDHYSERRM